MLRAMHILCIALCVSKKSFLPAEFVFRTSKSSEYR